MALATDIPSRADIEALATTSRAGAVSIYLPTSPLSQDSEASRIELGNLSARALDQLRAAEHDKREVAAIEQQITSLLDDTPFWRFQSITLALFVTPERSTTFRLPNRLGTFVEVSDRFLVKPLLRAVTFPQAAFILAIAQNSVRLVEISADQPPRVLDDVDLPTDAASAVGLPSISGRAPHGGRVHGSEGQKVRLAQYARAVDRALRGVLTGQSRPLILAAADPLDDIYRAVNSYPHLLTRTLPGNPEKTADAELAGAAREVLDAHYAEQLVELATLFDERGSQGRALYDVADIARAATYGSVETLVLDIDQAIPGFVDDAGAVTFDKADDAINYGVVDETARRALLSGARILAVRQPDVPGGGAVAAILRYAP